MLLTVNNESTCPQYNLALEEYLCSRNNELFMLWQNEPSVIIGRFVNVNEDVNADSGIQIIRRNSGGGSVYHDLGNVNYTFILRDNRDFTLKYFSDIMINALNAIGINAELSFRHNDILADGMKISGAAQYHHDNIILHHGTLLFDSNLEAMKRALKHSGNIANIKPLLKHDMTVREFMNTLHDSMNVHETLTLSEEDESRIKTLTHRKYLNDKWNLEGMNPYNNV
ncbi:MAG: lipoate--protein ligase family protein [Synergistaceae bacterium]|nr:lipoate--protein ligase family protein [Synergistaceae bacterium]MBQ3449308.1 lipoate--protein ligase family protein [Synergistaceae bacterium]